MCVSTLLFSAPHPVPPGQHPLRILRFTHHMQAIKFSLVYRVAARKGLLEAERLRTSAVTIILLQRTSEKVS